MTDGIDEWTQQIHRGDAVEVLQQMPESSVHCIVTSAGYYGLRDYGVDGQIGLEESVDGYVQALVDAARELRRVLRPDGNFWLNLGDTFAGGGGVAGKPDEWEDLHDDEQYPDDPPAKHTRFPRKCKLLVPQRVAIALIDDGWVCRGDPPWFKTNYKPHPVADRLVERKEYVYHFAPRPMYWWDLESIRVPVKESSVRRAGRADNRVAPRAKERVHPPETHDPSQHVHPNGKNPGDVFVGPVSNFQGEHSATFPEWLPVLPIKSSCPPAVCADCGVPYDREVEVVERAVGGGTPKLIFDEAGYKHRSGNHEGRREGLTQPTKRVVGPWEQTCDCDTDETQPGIVLDPFAGAGTTCLVAKRLGRRFIGVDLNPEYVAMAQKRVGLTVEQPELLADVDDGWRPLDAFADGGGPT